MRSRTGGAFSPIPPAKMSASRPPSAAAYAPTIFLRAITEESDGFGCVLVARFFFEEVAHVAARPGDTEEAGLLVEKRVDVARR